MELRRPGHTRRGHRRPEHGSRERGARQRAPPASAAPSASASPAASIPPGWTEHDIAARDVVRRYVGNLAPVFAEIYPPEVFAKLADILGAADNYPELQQKPSFAQVQNLLITDAVSPLTPELDGDVKVFRMTVDEMEWPIDEKLPTVAALGLQRPVAGPDDPRHRG